jgi:hypothetical protein
MAYRPLLLRNPRMIPAIMFSAGLAVAGYYGLAWYQMPQFSEQEIEQSTELNLALDLAQRSAQERPQGLQLEALKARVRADVENDIHSELKVAQVRFSLGLIAMVFGLSQLVSLHLSERAKGAG